MPDDATNSISAEEQLPKDDHPADKFVYIAYRHGGRIEREYETLGSALDAAHYDHEYGEASAVSICRGGTIVVSVDDMLKGSR